MVQFQRLDKDSGQDQRIQSSLLPSIPSVPKPLELSQCNKYSSQDKTHYMLSSKIPKNITHELPHNHSKNPKHGHPLLCVGPYRNTCNNSRPFFDILSTTEVLSSRFFQSSSFNQVLLLSIYNNQSPNSTHSFHFSKKSSN